MRRLCWFAVIGAYAAVLFAYLFPPDYGSASWTYAIVAWVAFSIRTVLLHLGGALVIVAITAWGLRGPWVALFALPLIAFALGPPLWAALPKSPPPAQQPTFRLMSVNLWYRDRSVRPVLDKIAAADPDVLLLQEYTPDAHRAFRRRFGDRYPHRAMTPRPGLTGMAIYSRLPFIGPVRSDLPFAEEGAPQQRAVLKLGGRKLALYHVHLHQPLAMRALMRRRRQLHRFIETLRDEPLPTVAAGDFNFTDRSPPAAALHRLGMTSAHQLAGSGLGMTWPSVGWRRYLAWPGFRIDHAYLTRELTATEARVVEAPASDHRSIVTTLGFGATSH